MKDNSLFITYHKQLTKYTQLVGGCGAGQKSPRNLLFTRRGSQGGDLHCLHQDQPLLTMVSREHGPPPTALTSDREQRTGGVKSKLFLVIYKLFLVIYIQLNLKTLTSSILYIDKVVRLNIFYIFNLTTFLL